MMETFFEVLLGDKEPNQHILIWERYNKSSSWFKDIPKAIEYVRENASHDIYVGCGTSPKHFGSRGRCPAEQIVGIPGLWLDLDTKHPMHKKQSLPETEEDVQNVLSCFPLAPTLDIHSGHGRQFWWAFKEFWSFESTEQRLQAANLMHRFNIMFRDHSKSLGYELDMTFDLARIMRIPGTMNTKEAGVPKPVSLLACNSERYNVDDLEAYMPKIDLPLVAPKMETPVRKGEKFTLDPNAEPPFNKFNVLCDNEPLFRQSWEMKRKFPSGKDSGSEYDMSLATFAFQAGWSWQEVVNLLISFRRTRGLRPKTVNENDPASPLREQYYTKTLTLASADSQRQQAQEQVDDYVNKVGETIELPPDQRSQEVRKHVSMLLGVPITRICKMMTSPPTYTIETPRGSVTLGGSDHILDQKLLRKHLCDVTDHVLAPVSKDKWFNVAQALISACEEVYVGDDSTTIGIMRRWLRKYFEYRPPIYDVEQAFISEEPYAWGDNLYLFGPDFRSFLETFHKEKVSAQAMAVMLQEIGFTAKRQGCKKPSTGEDEPGRTTKYPWFIPITNPTVSAYVNLETLRAAEESNQPARGRKRQA